MREHTFSKNAWRWMQVDTDSNLEITSLQNLPRLSKIWVEKIQEEKTLNLEIEGAEEGIESMWGSIAYHQDIEEREQQSILQYHLTRDTLVTNLIDFSTGSLLSEKDLLGKMQNADNAIEGFMILVGEIVSSFLREIDAFESRMHDLLWRMKENNDDSVFNMVMDNRHEILVWKNLIVPLIEVREAIKEAFGDSAANNTHYQRAYLRINRCREIIREYDEELGEMIDLETVIASYRGNEIFKTLTIITMLFTPVASLGALWGMNFEVMPELKWKYGYVAALLVIFLSTAGLYYYLVKKNWVGHLLKSSKNKKF